MLCPDSLYRRKKPLETKFTKTDCCFFANKRYLCPRKEVAPPSKDTVVCATHVKSRCTIGGGRPIFGPEHKPVSARKLEWWNGRHEGLKILWPLRLCGFESRFEYREPRRIFCVALLFLRLQTLLLLCIINLLNNRVYKGTNYQSLPFVFYFIYIIKTNRFSLFLCKP